MAREKKPTVEKKTKSIISEFKQRRLIQKCLLGTARTPEEKKFCQEQGLR